MPTPDFNSVIIPVALQNLSIQYRPQGMINQEIFPIVPVTNPQHKVLKYTKASYYRVDKTSMYRAPGTLRKRVSYDVGTMSINPQQVSREIAVVDEYVDLSTMPGQYPFNPQIDAVQRLRTEVDLLKEVILSDTIWATTWLDGYAGGITAAGGWGSTGMDNTFVHDVMTAKAAFVASHGYYPNRLMLDYSTFAAQQYNPMIQDKIKYTQLGILTEQLIASVLGIEKVVIGVTPYTAANENSAVTDATTTLTQIWNPSGKGNAFLYHYAAPSLRTVAAGFQYRVPYMGSMSLMRGYRDEPVSATIYQLTENVEISPVATDMGYAWKDTITA